MSEPKNMLLILCGAIVYATENGRHWPSLTIGDIRDTVAQIEHLQRELAEVLDADRRKTAEYNLLVREINELRAAHVIRCVLKACNEPAMALGSYCERHGIEAGRS